MFEYTFHLIMIEWHLFPFALNMLIGHDEQFLSFKVQHTASNSDDITTI